MNHLEGVADLELIWGRCEVMDASTLKDTRQTGVKVLMKWRVN